MTLSPWRLYLTIAASAIVVHLGALGNGFALDDVPIIATNPLVHRWSGLLEAFRAPYWPATAGAAMYRPLTVAAFALDWQTGLLAWLHGVNVLWHAAVSVAVAALVRRWSGSAGGALVAGVLFAVHPVHVEAVANLVGRAELMAALFALLSVYAALEHDLLGWSCAALVLGLLSKETAAIVPGLIAAGWITGLTRRPSRRRVLAYFASWLCIGVLYAVVRWTILRPYSDQVQVAPVFVGATFAASRLTAVSSFADFARLLLFPLQLRVDYSPGERTLVSTPLDARFVVGTLCLALWVGLGILAWRRGHRLAGAGLCWSLLALLPVANLLFPTGVLVAERTLYLPSAGLAIAMGAWAKDLPNRKLLPIVALLFLAGGLRTAFRVPVWTSSERVLESVREDSPRSYVGPMWTASSALAAHHPEDAFNEFHVAASRTTGAPKLLALGADAAFALGRSRVADSLLNELGRICSRCAFYYEFEARAALARGDSSVADSIRIRMSGLDRR
jgi:protein O-mannosyl-transferase